MTIRRQANYLVHGIFCAVTLFALSCKTRSTSSAKESGDSGQAQPFTGIAPYKLIFINHAGPQFDPNEDILNPSSAQKGREKIDEVVTGSLMKSLIPIYSNLTGNKTGTEQDGFQSLLNMVSKIQASLKAQIQDVEGTQSVQFPMVHDVYLVPWPDRIQDTFYGAEKLSVDAGGLVNVLGSSPTSEAFPVKITEAIKKAQSSMYSSSPDPVYLLGFRSFLFISPGASKHTLRFLVGIKPLSKPFEKTTDQVKLSKLVVPDIAGKGIVGSFRFEVDLNASGKPPMLYAEFGDFDKLEKGEFKVSQSGQAKAAPRLEGNANKRGLTWVATNFNFARLAFDLRQMQLTSIDTLISPGLKLGSSSFVIGGLNISSVDTQFQTEINATVDQQIQGALQSNSDKILNGMVDKQMIDQLFAAIFTRGNAQ